MTAGIRGGLGRGLVWVWLASAGVSCADPESPASRHEPTDAGRDLQDAAGWAPPGSPCPDEPRSTEVQPTGSAESIRITEDCPPGTTCRLVGGARTCVREPGTCTPGTRRCTESAALKRCTTAGAWASAECATICAPSPLGAFCLPSLDTRTHTGVVQYELREPLLDLADWAPEPTLRPAPDIIVATRRAGALIDVVVADDQGGFELSAPQTLTADDELVVYAAVADNGLLPLMVARPEVREGTVDVDAVSDGTPWSWTVPLAEAPTGSTVVIGETEGSTALHLLDLANQARRRARAAFGSAPDPIVIWLRQGTDWSCTACFLPASIHLDGHDFKAQIFIPATAGNRSDRLVSPIWHELGHWIMASFGALPEEGGRHCLGEPTFPGQAWSEGWATAYSAIQRGDPRYVDERGGAFLWFDIEARTYSTGAPWQRPTADGSLDQRVDENEIAAMLWRLARDPDVGQGALHAALTVSGVGSAPFGRGYVAHEWELDQCAPESVSPKDVQAPTFADFLDALVCGGAPPSAVDAVTEPETAFPFPSRDPICP